MKPMKDEIDRLMAPMQRAVMRAKSPVTTARTGLSPRLTSLMGEAYCEALREGAQNALRAVARRRIEGEKQ